MSGCWREVARASVRGGRLARDHTHGPAVRTSLDMRTEKLLELAQCNHDVPSLQLTHVGQADKRACGARKHRHVRDTVLRDERDDCVPGNNKVERRLCDETRCD